MLARCLVARLICRTKSVGYPNERSALSTVRSRVFLLTCTLLFCLAVACGSQGKEPAPATKNPQELTLAEIGRQDSLGRGMLHRAVLDNDLALLRAAVSRGPELDTKDRSGHTALHRAVQNGNHPALKILIDAGADIALPLPNGDSPLQLAVLANDVTAAEYLYLSSRNHDIPLDKDAVHRPLTIHALQHELYSIIELFLRPLHYIVKRDKPEYLAHLLALERSFTQQTDDKGMTPLHIAYLYHNAGFADSLIAAGADQTVRDVYGKRPADYTVDGVVGECEVNTLDRRTASLIEDRVLDFFMHHDWLTLGIVKDGEIAYLKSYGPKNMLDADAVHASVSKPMTSIIFLRLMKEGTIRSLDDDIGEYSQKYRDVMPNAYAHDRITFRQILTHTSGIPHIRTALWRDGRLNLLFKPGTRFEYSTNAFSILGEIMSEVTGRSFSGLVKEHIGQPVGATSFWAEDTFRAPAARIHSTTRDFLKFVMGVIGNSYLSEKEFDEILVGRRREETLGWGTSNIGTPDLTLAHSGSNGRPRSHFVIKPKKKIALVLMGQTKTAYTDIWFLRLAPILMDIIEGKGGY